MNRTTFFKKSHATVRRQTRLVIYKCSQEIEPGTTWNKLNEWSEHVLNPGSPDLMASALTTGPHCYSVITAFVFTFLPFRAFHSICFHIFALQSFSERVSIECRKTKTKVITFANQKGRRQSGKPIKTRSSQHKAREKVHARATIGLGFTSDWLKKWRENFEPITEWSNAKPWKQFANHFRHSIENRSNQIFLFVAHFNNKSQDECQEIQSLSKDYWWYYLSSAALLSLRFRLCICLAFNFIYSLEDH